jgi:parallel beta-helix repeat protein
MKLVRRLALAAVSLGAMFAVTAIMPSAQASVGTMVVTANRTLSQDHRGTILVRADGITLDCGSSRVIGKGFGAGIDLAGRGKVTVRNCAIAGFDNGIRLVDSHGNNFEEVTVDGSAGAGCSLLRSNLNLFINSNFTNNAGGGCEFVESHYNIFERNVVIDNTDEGLDLELSNNNTFTANDVSSNDSDGFDLENSHGNDILQNVIVGNTANGVELDFANDNAIDDNQVISNGHGTFRNGITLDASLRNAIRGNISNANARDGIRISDFSNDNEIANNSACNNGDWDGNLDSGTGNVFTGNMFCRQSPGTP